MKIILLVFLIAFGSLYACDPNPYSCFIMGEGNYCWDFENPKHAKKIYDELIAYKKELEKIDILMAKEAAYLIGEKAIHIFKCCIEPGIMWQTKEEYKYECENK